MSNITDEDRAKILLAYANGTTAGMLAEKYPQYTFSQIDNLISRQKKVGTINRVDVELGLKKKKKPKVYARPSQRKPKEPNIQMIERNNAICNEYFEGASVSELCKQYKLHENTIYTILKSSGRKKPRHRAISENSKKILEDLKEGTLTQVEIARKHGVTKQLVNRIYQVHFKNKRWEKKKKTIRKKPKRKKKFIKFDLDDTVL